MSKRLWICFGHADENLPASVVNFGWVRHTAADVERIEQERAQAAEDDGYDPTPHPCCPARPCGNSIRCGWHRLVPA